MDYKRFYRELFAPLEATHGPIADHTLSAIVGFDAGGPLSFRMFERPVGEAHTYVSCELAVRVEQQPSDLGRYELLATSDDLDWVRTTLSDIARETFEASFGPGHTLDIGPWTSPDATIQGVIFEEASRSRIDEQDYCVLSCIGVTRPELEFAYDVGVSSLLDALRVAQIYPKTVSDRESVK